MKSIFVLCAAVFLPNFAYADLKVGATPSQIILKDKEGGRTDGKPWDSSSITGKVYSLFYVDPDEKGANEALEKRLADEKFDRKLFGSIAIVNLAATWKPNFIIEKILASKQKEFPDTIYVKDKVSKLVKEWQLKDNSYNAVLFDKTGKVLISKAGTLSKADIDQYIATIKKSL